MIEQTYWTKRVRLTLSFWTLKKLLTPLHTNFLTANCLVMVYVELHWRQQRVVVIGVTPDWTPVVSGVTQGYVFGPLLFSLYINGIPVGIDPQIRLFADDCVCYHEIRTVEDTLKLQKDIDLLGSWARKWGMRFQPVKCNMMQLTNKQINKIDASYTLEGIILENVDSIKYLGVTITNDLK